MSGFEGFHQEVDGNFSRRAGLEPPEVDRPLFGECLVDRGAQGRPQLFPGHFQDVAGRFSHRHFEDPVDAGGNVHHLVPLVDDHAGGGVAVHQEPFRHRSGAQLQGFGLARGPRRSGEVPGRGGEGEEGSGLAPSFRPPEELPLLVQNSELVGRAPRRFRGAEKEDPARFQYLGEEGDEALLHVGVQVDEEIAADKEVEAREGGILDDAVMGEDDHFADLFRHLPPLAVPDKEGLEPFLSHLRLDPVRVEPCPGLGDGCFVDVGGEDLDPGVEPAVRPGTP